MAKNVITSRRQRLKLGAILNYSMEVLSDMPQGSILHLLLFYYLYDDLDKSRDDGYGLFMFADDCKLYKYILEAKDNQTLQSDLHALKNIR
jgi:hypothetical protein